MSNYDPVSQQKAQAIAAKAPHATKLQRWARITAAQSLIVSGATHREIIRHLMAEYGISQAMAYRYLNRADADWHRYLKTFDRGKILARQLAKADHLMLKAYARTKVTRVDGVRYEDPDPDHAGVAAAIKIQNELHGLTRPDEVEIAQKYLNEPLSRVSAALKAFVAGLAAIKFVIDASNEKQFVSMLGSTMRDALKQLPPEDKLIDVNVSVLDSRKRVVSNPTAIVDGL